jgi:hypothetical protein
MTLGGGGGGGEGGGGGGGGGGAQSRIFLQFLFCIICGEIWLKL